MRFIYKHLCIRVLGSQLLKKKKRTEKAKDNETWHIACAAFPNEIGHLRVDFLKVLYFFFQLGYAILKNFSYLFGAKFTGRKFYRWRHDNWPIGQRVIFHAAPNRAYVNHFFPAWIYNMIETSSLARSLRDLMRWSSLRTLLTTYEWSTCSKSNLRVAQSRCFKVKLSTKVLQLIWKWF